MKLDQTIIVLSSTIAIAHAKKSSSPRNPTHQLRRVEDTSDDYVEETITFNDPTHHNKLVDFCLSFKTGCGQPAADDYCGEKGYGDAVDYSKTRSYTKSTLTMDQHTTCTPANNVCDSFEYITCGVATQTYYDPTEHERPIDGCYKWESSCGDATADAFCEDKGHVRAYAYDVIESPEEETMTIGDHAVCDPAWHRCSTFSYITCVTSS